MRIVMSACILLTWSLVAQARPRFQKILSNGEPGTCSEIGGLWAGECIEDGKPRQAKLQIFQDGCTDIAFYDFDSSIPQVYKIGRETIVRNSKLSDSFANFTAYASWSDDRMSFIVSRLINFEYTYQHKTIRGNGDETYVVSLKGGELQTSSKGKGSNSSGEEGSDETTCTYRRSN